MRVYDGELCECGCSLMETQSGLYCPECGKIVTEWESVAEVKVGTQESRKKTSVRLPFLSS